jgi:hypothetical protein
LETLWHADLDEELMMIAKLLPLIFSIILAGFSRAQGPGDFDSGSGKASEYGPRPPLSVFDPAGILMPEWVKGISDRLAAIYQKEGVDVIVVVLADVGKAPPEHVARSFAKAWCKSPIHCVVLHVPGREDSPWIVPDGKLVDRLNPEQVSLAVENAQRRAASEPKDIDKVKAAATEAADMLRFWTASAINRSEMYELETAKIRAELEAESREWKTGVIIGATAAILLVAGLALSFVNYRQRGPRYFPLPALTRRLGAPHAGGNQAVVNLGAPPS